MSLTTSSIKSAVNSIHARIDVVGQELNELDGQVGDGDLGVTLINGFNNIQTIKDEMPADVGMAFFECAKAITKVSGSSFGTLMATALMAAGKQAKGQGQIAWSEVPNLLQAGMDAMIARGGASLGDKTVLDSLDAVIKATQGIDEPKVMLEAAVKASDEALAVFKNQQCKVGRARIFGERTVGMDDPGMVAIARMLECVS